MSYGSLIPAGISLLSGLGGLFGGKRKPSQYELMQADAAKQGLNLANTEQGYGTDAYGNYQKADAASQRQISDYADLLRQNPYTDQNVARQVGQMTAGTNGAYEAAKSNLAATLASRGLSDSSLANGGYAAIENAKAHDISNAYNTVYGQEEQNRYDRTQALTNLLQGNASNYGNQASGWLGAAGSGFGNAAVQYSQLAAQDTARQNYNDQSRAGAASALGSLGGLFAGGTSTGGSRATPYINGINNTYTSDNYAGGVPITPAVSPSGIGMPVTRKRTLGY